MVHINSHFLELFMCLTVFFQLDQYQKPTCVLCQNVKWFLPMRHDHEMETCNLTVGGVIEIQMLSCINC